MRQVTLISPITKQAIPKKRVAAYCRVSSDSKEQLHSYANQIDYYKKYIESHKDWELVEIFADEGLSGTKTSKREEFKRMIHLCELKKIDLIIAKSITRFARNTKDTLEYVRKLKLIGVGVYFEEQGINTLTLGDEMLLATFAAIAQEESVSISQNLRLSIVKRMENGSYVDSNAPYGFRLVDKRLVEYPPESEIVKRIFNEYLAGMSSTEIARDLEKEKIPTKYGNRHWKSTTITYLLSNERYIGDCLYQKTFRSTTVPFKQSKNRSNEDQYFAQATHEGFIDRDTFEKVQTLLAQRQKRHLRTTEYNTYPLTSLIHCAECGSSFRRRVVGGGISWVCTRHIEDKNKCDSHYYKEERIYDAFVAMVNKLRFDSRDILGFVEQSLTNAINKYKRSNEKAKQISQQMAELNAKLLMLEQLRSKNYLANDAYQNQASEINHQMAQLRNERTEELNTHLEEMLAQIKKLRKYLFEIEEPIEDCDTELLKQVVESILIDTSDKITFTILGDLRFTEQL